MKRIAIALLASLSLVSQLRADVYFNEIYANPPGTDQDFEWFELRGTASQSLNGIWALVIEGDGTVAGTIDQAINLTGLSLGTNGYHLRKDSLEALTPGIDLNTNVSIADFAPDIENGGQTYLLVTNFTGTVGTDYDVNNDGILDSTPWTLALDAVGLADTATTLTYTAGIAGSYSFPDLSFTADALVRDRVDLSWYAFDTTGPSPGPYNINPLSYSSQNGHLVASLDFTNLSPGSKNFTAIPEPSSLMMLGLAGLIAGFRRRSVA